MRWLLLGGLLVVIMACSPEELVCSPPYMEHGGKCCLDQNNDSSCDSSPELESGLDCSLCPPKFVTEIEEKIVYKYVCYNGTVMDSEEFCTERIVSDAALFNENREQDEDFILEFTTRPACRGKYKAAELHIVPIEAASAIVLQVMREPNTAFEDLYELNASVEILDDEYVYVGFCDNIDCTAITDTQLTADTAYMFRAEVVVNGERVFTRDRVVDPTPEGEYSQQSC